jgi:hypothetical protein
MTSTQIQNEVRQIALNQKYPEPEDSYTYPGKNSDHNIIQSPYIRSLRILNRKLTPAQPNGYFRLSLEKDTYRQDVHVDPSWEFGAVCYLNSPEQVLMRVEHLFGCIIKQNGNLPSN